MRMRASTWRPAAIPSILMIFMAGASNYPVGVRLSFAVSKAISNSGGPQFGDGLLEAVAAVPVVAKHVEAGEPRAEKDVATGGRGPRGSSNGLVEARAFRMGNAV